MKRINAINLFVFSSVSSLFAGSLIKILIILFATDYYGTSNAVAWITAASTIPFLLFGLLTGVIVDNSNKKVLLIICDLGRLFSFAAIFLFWYFDMLYLPFLIFLLILFGMFDTLYQTSESAVLPELAAEDKLEVYNGYIWSFSSAASIVGPMFAAFIYGITGGLWGLLLNVFLYGFSLFNLLCLPSLKSHNKEKDTRVFKQLVRGFDSIVSSKVLFISLIIMVSGNFLLAPIQFIIVSLMRFDLNISSELTGIVLSVTGIGGVIAGIVFPRIKNPLYKGKNLLIGTSALMFLGIIFIAFGRSIPFLVVGLLIITSCSSIRTVFVITLRMKKTPKHQLGVVSSFSKFASFGIQPLSILIFTVITNIITVKTTLFILTILFFVQFMFVTLTTRNSQDFEMEPGEKKEISI